MDLSLEDGSGLGEGGVASIRRIKVEDLGKALGGGPEGGARGSIGILGKGVDQLGYPLMEVRLQVNTRQSRDIHQPGSRSS